MSSTLSVIPPKATLPPRIKDAPTNPEWRTFALAIIKRLAKRRETITSADVLNELAKSDITTGDLRSLGSVMREGATLGYIASAGLVRQRSNKRSRGASTLWKSLVYQPKLQAKTDNS